MCNTGPQYERLLQFQSYTNLKFLKEYDSLDYVKRFIVNDDEQVSDFFNAQIRPKGKIEVLEQGIKLRKNISKSGAISLQYRLP